jgi:hypothetical protein
MTRFTWLGVWLLLGGLSGCLPNNFIAPDKTAAKPVEPQRPVTPPPVVAAQINQANAQEKAKALREELDRDMEQGIEANDPKPEKK